MEILIIGFLTNMHPEYIKSLKFCIKTVFHSLKYAACLVHYNVRLDLIKSS